MDCPAVCTICNEMRTKKHGSHTFFVYPSACNHNTPTRRKQMNKREKMYLVLSGIVIILVGSYIAMTPVMYLKQFSLGTDTQTSFLSEMRGMGGALFGYGILALLGALLPKLERAAIIAATVLFVSFSSFRLIGVALDGLPGQGILVALTVELVFAILGIYLIIRSPEPTLSHG